MQSRPITILPRLSLPWLALVLSSSCGSAPAPVGAIAPSAAARPASVRPGGVTDVTYRFTVAPDAASTPPDHTIFVHLLDDDGELLWAGDHQPPVPTDRWMPGDVIEYARPVAIPRGLMNEDVYLHVGLFGPSGARLPLRADGGRDFSYRVATLRVGRPGGEPPAAFADGWQAVDIPDNSGTGEWYWSTREGAILLPNPRRAALFVLDVDQPLKALPEPQRVEVRLGTEVIDSFTLMPGARELRRVPIAAAQLGDADVTRVTLTVDPAFVPAQVPALANTDTRELGVRAFHAYFVEQEHDARR